MKARETGCAGCGSSLGALLSEGWVTGSSAKLERSGSLAPSRPGLHRIRQRGKGVCLRQC